MRAPTFYIKMVPDFPVSLPCCQESRLAAVEPDQEADKGLPVFGDPLFWYRGVLNVDWGGWTWLPESALPPLVHTRAPTFYIKKAPEVGLPGFTGKAQRDLGQWF